MNRPTGKPFFAAAAGVALLGLIVIGFLMGSVMRTNPAPVATQSDQMPPTAITRADQVPTATTRAVAQIQPGEPTVQPTATVNLDALPNPALVTPSPTVMPGNVEQGATATPVQAQAAAPTPKPHTGTSAVLRNGVRYGDHTPDVPNRIVRIYAPSINLDAKVYEVYAKNGAWEVAEYAAGHNYNAKNPGEGGNIVLSGHNNWRGEVFRDLDKLKAGDEITLWTLEGKEYKYAVQETEKLKEAGATMAQRVQNGKVMLDTPSEQLTLITCWPYTTFTHRLIVIAKPVS